VYIRLGGIFTLQVALVGLLGDTFHLLISELVGKIEDCLAWAIIATLVGVLALGGWVGTLQHEVLAALLDHLAVDLPQAIAGVDDFGGVGDDLVATEQILGNLLTIQIYSQLVMLFALYVVGGAAQAEGYSVGGGCLLCRLSFWRVSRSVSLKAVPQCANSKEPIYQASEVVGQEIKEKLQAGQF
jgi:hypothetical protein